MSRSAKSSAVTPQIAFQIVEGITASPTKIVFCLDTEGKITYITGGGLKLLGIKVGENITRSFDEVQQQYPVVRQLIQKALQGEISEVKDWFYDRFLRIECVPMYENGKISGVLGMSDDETETVLAEQELKDEQARFRAVFEASQDGLFAASDGDRQNMVNIRLLEMFTGYEEIFSSCSPKRIAELYHQVAENGDEFIAAVNDLRRTFCDQHGILRLRDGRFYEWHGVSTDDGLYTGSRTQIWAFSDITQRYLSHEQIRISEEKFRNLFDSMPDGFVVFDMIRDETGKVVDFRVADVNPAMCRLVNKPQEVLVGKSWDILFQGKPQLVSHHFGPDWITEFVSRVLAGNRDTYTTYDSADDTYQRLDVFFPHPERIGFFVCDVTEQVKSDLERQNREQLLSTILETSEDGIIAYYSTGEVIHTNNKAKRTFAYWAKEYGYDVKDVLASREAMRSLIFDIVVNPDELRDRVKQFYQDNEPLEMTFPTKNGRVLQFKMYAVLSADPGGTIIVTGRSKDITEGYYAEQTLKMMQLVIEHLSDAVVWISTTGEIQYTNDAARKLLGYTQADFPSGEKIWDYGLSMADGTWEEFCNKIYQQKTVRFDTQIKRKDRTTLSCHVVVDLLESNGKQFFAVCVHDLTERILRIGAEQATLAKTKFLATMSHEIRTPLNGVIGTIDLLLGTKLTTKQQEYAELAGASGKYLLSLINSVLDFSKIESGKLELESVEFDLPELTESVLGIVAAKVFDNHLELCGLFLTDVPRKVIGDAGRVRQILVNLLSNAVKFTSKGGVKLTVAAENREREDTGGNPFSNVNDSVVIRFEVTDTGIGISEDRLDRLFQSFSQVDSSFARKYGGTGLGLAISKELVNLMGGEIGVRSKENEGSTFWFRLPFRCSDQTALASGIFKHGFLELKNHLAVVVDDNDYLRDELLMQLKTWGMNVSTFKSRNKAIAAVREAAKNGHPFSVAIIDQKLEDAAGSDLAGDIKGDAALSSTAVIMLSPLLEDTNSQLLQSGQVDRYVSKPIFGSALFNAILAVLTGAEDTSRDRKSRRLEEWKRVRKENQSLHRILNDFAGESSQTGGDTLPVDSNTPLILVAEDNRINQIVVGEILKQAGYRFELVSNGKKATEAFEQKKYSLILMDCQMPEMDGFQATQEIRKKEHSAEQSIQENLCPIPIIALTANATEGDEGRCLAAGMNAYCSKPVNADQLIETVKKWLKQN